LAQSLRSRVQVLPLKPEETEKKVSKPKLLAASKISSPEMVSFWLSMVPSTEHLLHCARVWMGTKLAPYSQFGLSKTPPSLGMMSGDRPE